MSADTPDSHSHTSVFAYGTLTLFGLTSQSILLTLYVVLCVLTPYMFPYPVWPLSLSLATTRKISVDFSSYGYLDVSVPRVPLPNLFIQFGIYDSSPYVFPHSDTSGSLLIYSSPELFAVNRVLLRLLMPRHSPYALFSLNFFQTVFLFSLVLFFVIA